jgi:hypothetical protein
MLWSSCLVTAVYSDRVTDLGSIWWRMLMFRRNGTPVAGSRYTTSGPSWPGTTVQDVCLLNDTPDGSLYRTQAAPPLDTVDAVVVVLVLAPCDDD